MIHLGWKFRVRLPLNPFVIKMGFVRGARFNHNRKPSLLFNCGVMRRAIHHCYHKDHQYHCDRICLTRHHQTGTETSETKTELSPGYVVSSLYYLTFNYSSPGFHGLMTMGILLDIEILISSSVINRSQCSASFKLKLNLM